MDCTDTGLERILETADNSASSQPQEKVDFLKRSLALFLTAAVLYGASLLWKIDISSLILHDKQAQIEQDMAGENTRKKREMHEYYVSKAGFQTEGHDKNGNLMAYKVISVTGCSLIDKGGKKWDFSRGEEIVWCKGGYIIDRDHDNVADVVLIYEGLAAGKYVEFIATEGEKKLPICSSLSHNEAFDIAASASARFEEIKDALHVVEKLKGYNHRINPFK